MRYYLLVFIAIIIFSCQKHNSLDRYVKELPDSNMVNDVILTVIQIDSLDFESDLLSTLEEMRVYSRPKYENDIMPIGPPPIYSVTLEDLYSQFNSTSNSLKQIDDSIFIRLQTDTSIHFKIRHDIYSRFKPNPQLRYLFYIPIFSFDKQFVFVQYCRSFAGECDCSSIILKWSNIKWELVDRW